MYPQSILENVSWVLDDSTYDSIEEFVNAVSARVDAENAAMKDAGQPTDDAWKPAEIALDETQLTSSGVMH